MERILFIDSCSREDSRTRRLAQRLLKGLDGDSHTLLTDGFVSPMTGAEAAKRDELIAKGALNDPLLRYACLFAAADEIVVAAPYWDLSFPASLKALLEWVSAVGVTFAYDEKGVPHGLCKARRLWYVTAVGGADQPLEFGYGYVKALCERHFGIPETRLVMAQGLDLEGADVEAVLSEAEKRIDAEVKELGE